MERALKKLFILIVALSSLTACYSEEDRGYYADKDNYISTTAQIVHIKYSDDNELLCLAFEGLPKEYEDNNFQITGENLRIVLENDIKNKIDIGDTITFVSAPLYLGDGYMMPIVSLSVNGESLLEFEQGFFNFQEWLKENR